MRKQYFLYLVFISLFIASILVILASSQEDEKNGSITGRVLPPKSNATVYVVWAHYNDAFKIIDYTEINSTGFFMLSNIPAGIYDLIIIPKGDYINKSLLQIGVKENDTIELPDIILSRIGETGSISGYIKPTIPGLEIQIKRFGATQIDSYDIVEEDGSYKFTGLTPDTYGLFVYFNKSQNYYNYKWGMIDLIGNHSLTDINLTFTPKDSKYMLDHILIGFAGGISENEKISIIKSYGCSIMEHYSYMTVYTIKIPEDKTVEEMERILKEDSRINRIVLIGESSLGSGGGDKRNDEQPGEEELSRQKPDPDDVFEFVANESKNQINISEKNNLINQTVLSASPNKKGESWLSKFLRYFMSWWN